MKHMSVTKKLWLGVFSIVLSSIFIVVHAGYNSASHQKKFNAQDSLLSNRLDQATQWSAFAQVNVVRTQAALISTDAQDAKDFRDHIQRDQAAIDALQQALLSTSTSEQDLSALRNLQALGQVAATESQKALEAHRQGDLQTARQATRTGYLQAANSYTQALNAYVQQQAHDLAHMRAQMGAARQGVVRASAVNMVILLLGIAAGAYLLIGNIRRALQQANTIAEHIAAGDLRTQFSPQRNDEFGQLLSSLQRMSLSLSTMMHKVRQSADAISLASHEIASGNQNLSHRTATTSSHLQQAASAMMELTQNLQETADSAQQAATMASQASDVAQKGGSVVNEVVHTMNDIHGRSQKIADIIGVIDSIAFQTNILALNAAVEAARAGDQGRGFAVVASEVRTLAHRSAQAAKEIKQLIEDSVSRIADGARLVQDAGTTMEEVVQSIEHVTDVMSSINTHAAQQRHGITQVNHAVDSLDEMTQQNAALVEQSTAASLSLHAQSEHLRELVQQFKTQAAPAFIPGMPLPVVQMTELASYTTPATAHPAAPAKKRLVAA